MSDSAVGLALPADVEPEGAVRLDWRHGDSRPRIPGTLYDLELEPPGAAPIQVRALAFAAVLLAATLSGAPASARSSRRRRRTSPP